MCVIYYLGKTFQKVYEFIKGPLSNSKKGLIAKRNFLKTFQVP